MQGISRVVTHALMSSYPAIEPKTNRAVTTVRILTWLTVSLFLVVLLIVPRGITVPWGLYFILFVPIMAADFSALFAFAYCRVRGHAVSPAYALMSVAVLVGVWYITWFELRLRWYEVLR
jgi:hypothetical protein